MKQKSDKNYHVAKDKLSDFLRLLNLLLISDGRVIKINIYLNNQNIKALSYFYE